MLNLIKNLLLDLVSEERNQIISGVVLVLFLVRGTVYMTEAPPPESESEVIQVEKQEMASTKVSPTKLVKKSGTVESEKIDESLAPSSTEEAKTEEQVAKEDPQGGTAGWFPRALMRGKASISRSIASLSGSGNNSLTDQPVVGGGVLKKDETTDPVSSGGSSGGGNQNTPTTPTTPTVQAVTGNFILSIGTITTGPYAHTSSSGVTSGQKTFVQESQ